MEFSGPSSLSDRISLAIEGGTFNVQTATCGGGTSCIICVGLASCAVSPNPTNVSVGSSSQATATGTYSNGSTENDTSRSSWSSSATSIATVETKGDANPGLVSGVSPGTATVTVDDPSFASGKACGLFPTCTVVIVACSLPTNVTPTVNLSCTLANLALGPTAPSSTTTGSCTTNANPAGGTFSWSVNKNTVTLSSTSGASVNYTAANPSSAQGDTTILVTYTVNNQSATEGATGITVRNPTSLFLCSTCDTINPTGKSCSVPCLAQAGTCNATTSTCAYNSYLRTRQYSVVDQFGNLFENVGLSQVTVAETVPTTTSCPGLTIQTGSFSQSPFPDSFFLCSTCCLSGGLGCSSSTNPVQTIYANGIPVRTETINWTCTGVTLSP